MKLLAFDATRESVSVAILGDGIVIAGEDRAMRRGHAAAILPMIVSAMAKASLDFAALDALATTVGPGSYTGIRIGLAAAEGLSLSLGIPVIGVSNLEAQAQALNLGLRAGRNLLVVLKSGRPEPYAQAFDPNLEPLGDPAVLRCEALADLVPAGTALALGDGLRDCAGALASARPDIEQLLECPAIDAAAVGAVGARKLARADGGSLPAALPLYLRPADVTRQPERTPNPNSRGPALDIRPAGAFDLALLAAIHARCFSRAWSQDAMAKLLADPGAHALIAAASGEPAGFVLFRCAGGEAEILSLGVLPEARRRGLGRALTEAAIEKSLAGATRLFLEVAIDNEAARRLYESAGFREVGLRPDYYREAGKSTGALILARGLKP